MGCSLEYHLIGTISVYNVYAFKIIIIILFLDQEAGRSPPPDPVEPPRLIPDRSSGRTGQFIVSLSAAAPQPQEDEIVDRTNVSAVTFLFRFEDMNSSKVFFNWTVS